MSKFVISIFPINDSASAAIVMTKFIAYIQTLSKLEELIYNPDFQDICVLMKWTVHWPWEMW